MRPICLDMLFTPVDYIFVICLRKFLSWLVGVQSRACLSNFICNIISFLSFCSEGVIQFWAVTWALSLKTWIKSWGCQHNTEQASHWTLACHTVGASRTLSTLECPYHGRVQALIGQKTQWHSGAGYLRGLDGSRESCCCCGRSVWCVSIGSNSLM